MAAATRRGRRRKGTVIDLEQRQVVKSRRRGILMALLWLEGLLAAIAVVVLVVYIAVSGDQISR